MFFEGLDRGRFSNASKSDSNALAVLAGPIDIKPPILWANFMRTDSFIAFPLDEDTAIVIALGTFTRQWQAPVLYHLSHTHKVC
jgi:hypothetical protein